MKKLIKTLLLVTSLLVATIFVACQNKTVANDVTQQNEVEVDNANQDGEQLAGDVNPEMQTENQTEPPMERKKFVVGFDAEYPPYGFIQEDGSYAGFDLDLAREFANRNELDFVAQPIDWDSKDLELNSGSIDCIWNGFTCTGREDDYEWTVPYIDNSIVIMVNKDSDIKSKEDLAGKIVAVQAGSSGYQALAEGEDTSLVESFKKLETTPDYNTAVMNLESGLVDAVVIDIGVANFQIKGKEDKFVILDEAVSKEQYAVGFKKGNTELRDLVEKTLKEMYYDNTFPSIAFQYEEYNIPQMMCLQNYLD